MKMINRMRLLQKLNGWDEFLARFVSARASTFKKQQLLKMAENDPSLIAVTPAMSAGSQLDAMMEKFPERCLDVGIAESHSITFCGRNFKKLQIRIYLKCIIFQLLNINIYVW